MLSLRSLRSLFTARLSRKIVFWVFLNIIVIEAIILVPSVRKREQELLSELQRISAIAVSLIRQQTPQNQSELQFSQQLEPLRLNPVVIGGTLYRSNGEQVYSFGRSPELSWRNARGQNVWTFRSADSLYYDVAYQPEEWNQEYLLILRHDASSVRPELRAYIWRITGLVAIISVFVTTATLLALGPVAIAPILELRNDLTHVGEAIQEEQQTVNFKSLAYYRNDELGETILAFGEMFAQLADAIAERQQAEIALQHLNQDLEQRVEQRTAALNAEKEKSEQALKQLQRAQAQLIHAEKMSGLGQMVAGIAHEINNPISFIYSNLTPATEYIQDLLALIDLYQTTYPQTTPEIHEQIEAMDIDFLVKDLPKLLNSMQTGADRIRQIVLSLRTFSRLDETALKPVDLHAGLDSTLAMLQHRLPGNDRRPAIVIVKDYGNLPLVNCYANHLNQVFLNLLDNAIEALEMLYTQNSKSPDSSVPTIRIATTISDDRQAVVRIADNGPGVPEAARSRLFDPFFTTKPIGRGTGLGLAISYQIVVEEHGGRLSYQSTPQQGTVFDITLPLRVPKGRRSHRSNPN